MSDKSEPIDICLTTFRRCYSLVKGESATMTIEETEENGRAIIHEAMTRMMFGGCRWCGLPDRGR